MPDESRRALASAPPVPRRAPRRTRIDGVSLHAMTLVEDARGTLSAGEFAAQVPFTPRRYFFVFDVPPTGIRGEHAHRKCHQFLICARGSVAVVVDNGEMSEEITLDAPDIGLYVPPLVWAVQRSYSSDALLLVFASDPYDPADYINDYDEFRRLAGNRG